MNPKLVLLLSAFITVLVLGVTSCATSNESQTITLLKQAGFKTMDASTFEKQQKLKSLKPDRLSTVKAANGTVYYVYPLHHQDLLYAGRGAEYSTYQNLRLAQQAQSEQLKSESRATSSWSEQVESSGGTDGSWEDVWSAPSD